jgi:p-methyltransferase
MISQSEVVQYEKYSELPLDRIDIYKNLVQLRMVYFDGGFHSHLDLYNKALFGKCFHEGSYTEKKHQLYSIWNFPGLNARLAVEPLINEGYNVKIINNFDAEFDTLCPICQQMPNPIIGISCTYILQWSELARMIKKISKSIPDAIIILGGAFIHDQFSNYGCNIFEKKMKKYHINYVIHSYHSEMDLYHLMQYLKGNQKRITDINNLMYIDSDNTFKTTQSVWNSSTLKPIAWSNQHIPKEHNVIQLRTGTGCPFRCAFCNYPSMAGKVSYASARDIFFQIDEIHRLNHIKHIIFIDDTFNVPPKRFKEIVSCLGKYQFQWYCFFRAQFAEEDLVKQMKENGCDGLYLGLESANDLVLKNMNKKARVKDYMRGLELIKKYEIPTFAAFVVGFPGETQKTIEDNIHFLNKGIVDYYSIKEFYYLHNSPVHDKRFQFGLEGQGHIWHHDHMNSLQASEMKLYMFHHVSNSIHIDPDMGLWYLIFLRTKGFTYDIIRQVQLLINQMIDMDNSCHYSNEDKMPLFNHIKKLVRNELNDRYIH